MTIKNVHGLIRINSFASNVAIFDENYIYFEHLP